jgi:hypothetical protein
MLMEQEAAATAHARRRAKRYAILISGIAVGLLLALIAYSLARGR